MLCHLAHYQTRHDVSPVTYICIPTVPNNFMHVCFVNIFFYQTCQYLDVYFNRSKTDLGCFFFFGFPSRGSSDASLI